MQLKMLVLRTIVQMLSLLTASDENRCQNEWKHVALILLTLTRPVELYILPLSPCL